MKRWLQLLLMLFIVALVAAGACFLTLRFVTPRQIDQLAAHAGIHQRLGLSADQQKALEPIEGHFAEQQRALTQRIRDANAELALSIREDKGESPRISAAIEKIHAAQGDLQNATLQHVFDMRQVLRPDQYEKLLDLTADALSEAEHEE